MTTRQDHEAEQRTADRCVELVRQLARMTTPADEYPTHPDKHLWTDAQDYRDDLSSDRMEDEAATLWHLIEDARKLLDGAPGQAERDAYARADKQAQQIADDREATARHVLGLDPLEGAP